LLGYLVGGGVVWAVRMLGTLAFGQEAMGLGDVHLLAGVGACLGWIDPLLAFFVAPFFGLAWAVGARAASRVFRMSGAALPYGPHLAAAAVLVVLGKPWFEWGLVLILNEPVDLP
jgi:leader peptidase (prepilin peptidase)/N-methyltransferase